MIFVGLVQSKLDLCLILNDFIDRQQHRLSIQGPHLSPPQEVAALIQHLYNVEVRQYCF